LLSIKTPTCYLIKKSILAQPLKLRKARSEFYPFSAVSVGATYCSIPIPFSCIEKLMNKTAKLPVDFLSQVIMLVKSRKMRLHTKTAEV